MVYQNFDLVCLEVISLKAAVLFYVSQSMFVMVTYFINNAKRRAIDRLNVLDIF